MKRLLILILLLIPSLCMAADPIDWSKPYARMGVVTMGAGAAAAPSCSYSTKNSLTTVNNDQIFGYTSSTLWLGVVFNTTTPGAYTACRVTVKLFKQGTPTGRNIKAYIYADSGGSGPTGSALGTSTTTLAATDISETSYPGGAYNFDFSGVSLSASTNYWAVISISGAADTSNYVRTEENTAGTNGLYGSADGSSWSLIQSSCELYVVVTN